MRRFSQKNALVTLADINVTPLLDLAFVLLIIFVITTPLLEQSLQLDLPAGGRPEDLRLERSDIKTVDVNPAGGYRIGDANLTLDEAEQVLSGEFLKNPKLVVRIRGDKRAYYEAIALLIDRCQRHGITKVHLGMFPER